MEAVHHRDFAGLYRWSLDRPEAFWRSVWDFCTVIGEPGKRPFEHLDEMPGAHWFPDARLNFAENLLRSRDDSDAIVFWGEDKVRRRLSNAELYREVAGLAAELKSVGVTAGDRVAAWIPNMPETVIAMLAAASLGAV